MVKRVALVMIFLLVFTGITLADTDRDDSLRIVILYDNYLYQPGAELEKDWGFACLILGTEKTILFDTGASGPILMNNMKKLGISPGEIDILVISHNHYDHTGGLNDFLEQNPKVALYIPQSFLDDQGFTAIIKKHSPQMNARLKKYSPKIVTITGPQPICNRVYSTGATSHPIIEQSLIIETGQGMVIIAGCSHPGIVDIIRNAGDVLKGDIRYVLGGFHPWDTNKAPVMEIVQQMKDLKIRYISPTHCTESDIIGQFEKEYTANYLRVGVGKTISLVDLK
jgi:7,8-dihydropterin-6-yl-methyl-4-(beta-D-ribofuranosyl)aminobenzene 5'-phosphate synthase